MTTCTPFPESAFRYAASVATSVLPSPVFISEIWPWCSTMPPTSCTSKCRMFSVRRPASRTTANASTSTSSSVAPAASFSRSRAVCARRSASLSARTPGSRAPISATSGVSFFSVRAFWVPKTFARRVFSM